MLTAQEKAEQRFRQALSYSGSSFVSSDCLVWVGAKDRWGHNLYGKYRSLDEGELVGREYTVGMMGDKPSVIWTDAYFDFESRKTIRF